MKRVALATHELVENGEPILATLQPIGSSVADATRVVVLKLTVGFAKPTPTAKFKRRSATAYRWSLPG